MIRGEGDVGFLGSDKFKEWQPPLGVQWVGRIPGLDFVLAVENGQGEFWRDALTIDRSLKPIIPTSYPRWLGWCLMERGWQAEPRYVSGKVEAFKYVSGLVADLRLSGNTLRDNNLSELEVLGAVELGVVSRPQQFELPGLIAA